MRTWKSLLAESVLFTEPTFVENRLILTLTTEHASARNLRSITGQLQSIYKNSANFQKVFSNPQKVEQTIVLDLKKRYQRLSANQAMEIFVGFVIPEFAPMTQKEMQIQRRISKKAVLRNALDQGTLFKSVKQEGLNIHLTLSDEFNAPSNYPHIRSVLKALQHESKAFGKVFCDIKLSNHKPQLRLKHENKFNPTNLLAFIHQPNTNVLTPVQPEVAPNAASEDDDDFFKNLPDLFDNFSDDDSSPLTSPDTMLFRYTPPFVSSNFDLEALLENSIRNPIDSSCGSDFEEVVTKRAATI